MEDDTEAEALGSVKEALEAKLGARQFQAKIQAARSNSQHSNISALAKATAATRRPSSASAVFETASPARGQDHRRRRPSVFAKAVIDEENLANKSLVDERTPLVDGQRLAARGSQKVPSVRGGQLTAGNRTSSLRDVGKPKGSGRNLIQEEKVETKAVGFKA